MIMRIIFSVILFMMFLGNVAGCSEHKTLANHKTLKNQATPQASAPNKIYFHPENQTILPITLRLKNNNTKIIKLVESNPCAVFRWYIVNEQDRVIQSKPNKLCVQILATTQLKPNEQFEKSYNIVLDSLNYVADSNYRLMYKFWKHSGYHDFKIINQ